MQIGRRLLEVISAVLIAAEKKRADVALREALRTAELFPAEKSQVTQLVFAFYRWRGWLDLKKPCIVINVENEYASEVLAGTLWMKGCDVHLERREG